MTWSATSQVDTAQLADDSVSVPGAGELGSALVGNSTWRTIASDSVTIPVGGRVRVNTYVRTNGQTSGPPSNRLRIRRGATVIYDSGNFNNLDNWITIPYFNEPSSGTHTYDIQFNAGAAATIEEGAIVIDANLK